MPVSTLGTNCYFPESMINQPTPTWRYVTVPLGPTTVIPPIHHWNPVISFVNRNQHQCSDASAVLFAGLYSCKVSSCFLQSAPKSPIRIGFNMGPVAVVIITFSGKHSTSVAVLMLISVCGWCGRVSVVIRGNNSSWSQGYCHVLPSGGRLVDYWFGEITVEPKGTNWHVLPSGVWLVDFWPSNELVPDKNLLRACVCVYLSVCRSVLGQNYVATTLF